MAAANTSQGLLPRACLVIPLVSCPVTGKQRAWGGATPPRLLTVERGAQGSFQLRGRGRGWEGGTWRPGLGSNGTEGSIVCLQPGAQSRGRCRRNNKDVDGGYSEHRKGPWAPAREARLAPLLRAAFARRVQGSRAVPGSSEPGKGPGIADFLHEVPSSFCLSRQCSVLHTTPVSLLRPPQRVPPPGLYEFPGPSRRGLVFTPPRWPALRPGGSPLMGLYSLTHMPLPPLAPRLPPQLAPGAATVRVRQVWGQIPIGCLGAEALP